jgi:conjugal transfer pilus assembly protein TraU
MMGKAIVKLRSGRGFTPVAFSLCALLFLLSSSFANAECCGDPIESEEVAWEHMDEVENQGDCECQYGEFVRTGTLVTVWEPVRIIETVKDPYCMITTGEDNSGDEGNGMPGGNGADMPGADNQGVGEASDYGIGSVAAGAIPDMQWGTHSDTGAQEDHSVFQQVHITLPDYIMQSIMQIDNRCWHSSIGNPQDYISEDDAAWQDDTIAITAYPLTTLAADYEMQMACMVDSASSQLGFPNPLLYWCMGAWGSTYPMSGHVNNDEYIAGNAAIAARAIYIGGRTGRIYDAASYYCYAGPMPLWIKNYFKLQPIRPDHRDELIPIGLSAGVWGAGMNAEADCMDNFAWVLWRKRWCCDSQGGQNFNTQGGGGGTGGGGGGGNLPLPDMPSF